MSTHSAGSAPPLVGGLIDPTKQAEYPILLGDALARKGPGRGPRFVNMTYNHKSKTATPQQRSTLTRRSNAPETYDLVIKDKAGNAEQTTLTYTYEGTVDPSSSPVPPTDSELDTQSLVLTFDPIRKAFILEPVSVHLNFNLRSAPGKTSKQIVQQYPRLNTLLEVEHGGSGDDREKPSTSDDEIPLEDNPYDYRHFLPRVTSDTEQKSSSFARSTPDSQGITSKTNTPVLNAKKTEPPKPRSRVKTQSNPLRQVKQSAKQSTNGASGPASVKTQTKASERFNVEGLSSESAGSDEDQLPSTNLVAGEGTANLDADDDLIIDYGSPPTRPKFHVNPTHFSSNNVSADEADEYGDDEEEMEDLRLPSPARQGNRIENKHTVDPARDNPMNDYEEDDDALAAEMEAAFEESAREEEEARTQQYHPLTSHNQYAPSEDESEVSEEE